MWLEFLIKPTHTVESNCCCSCCGNNKVMTLTRKVRKTSRRKRKRRHHKHCNEKETDNNNTNYSNKCKYVNMNNNHNRNNHYHTPSTLNTFPAIKASHNINLCVQNDKSGNHDKEDNHCDDHRNDNNEVVVNSVKRRALAKVHCIYNINKCSSKNTNNNNNTTYNMNINSNKLRRQKQQSKQGHHLDGKSNDETGNTSCNFKIAHVGKASKEEILLATCLMPKDNANNISLGPPTPISTTTLTLPVLKQLSLPTPSKALTSSTGLTTMETARVVPISSTRTTAPNATEQVQLKQKDRMQTKYIHGLAKYSAIATTTRMRTIILSKSLNVTTHSPFRIRSMLKSASMLETHKRRYKTTARTAFTMSVQHGRYGLLGIPWLPSLYETWCTVIFATLLVLSICHNNGLQASALTEQVSLNKARPSDVENSSTTPRFQLNKHPPNNSLDEKNIQEKEQPQISQQLQIPQRWQHIQHTNNHFIYRNEQQQQEHMLGTEIAYGYDLAALDETNNTHSFQSLSIIDGGEELAADGSPTFWKHMTGYNEDITLPTPMNTMPVFDFGMPRNITARTGHTEAIIKCRVDRLHDKSVSWIRKRDLHILTVGTATYTSDKRFQVTESKDLREWTLHVKSPQTRDSGIYECQVNTEPKISMAFQLNVIEISPDAKAIITGPADLHFKVGSAIILTCLVQQPSVKDIGPIYWYRGEYIITPFNINDDDNDNIDDNIIVTPSSIQSGMLTQSVASNIAHKSSLSIINAAKLDIVDNYIENEQLLQQILANEINQDFAQRIAMESQLGDIMKSRLRISNAQASDTGNYTCQPTTASSASVMVHVINDENPAAMQKSAADSLKHRVLIVDAITIFYTMVSLLLAVSSVSISTLSKFLRYLHLRKGIYKIRVSSIERQQLLPPHCWRKLPSEPLLRIVMKIIVVYNLRQENSEQTKYICKHTYGAKCVEENVARHNHKNSDNLDGIIIISIKVFCKKMKTVHL